MSPVHQKAFFCTARIFRTPEGPLGYRMPTTQPPQPSSNHHSTPGSPVPNAINDRKEKSITCQGSTSHFVTFEARLAGGKTKRERYENRSLPIWGAMWGSNPRHPEPQSGALPTELIAPCQFGVTKVQRFFGIPREYSKKELSLCDWNKNRIVKYVKRDQVFSRL